MSIVLDIREDDLTSEEIFLFLRAHLDDMRAISPPESIHALDLNELRQPEITFWTAWLDNELVGCGAIKQLDAAHAEIKSMRTKPDQRGLGIASTLLRLILQVAKKRHYQWLYLETGSMTEFAPARAMYERYGFSYRPPFGEYKEDPHSTHMELAISQN
jgi:putative acetyltransferase